MTELHVRVHSHCTTTVKISLKKIADPAQSRVSSRSFLRNSGVSSHLQRVLF